MHGILLLREVGVGGRVQSCMVKREKIEEGLLIDRNLCDKKCCLDRDEYACGPSTRGYHIVTKEFKKIKWHWYVRADLAQKLRWCMLIQQLVLSF